VEVLDRHAPTWLVQMPAVLAAADREAVQRRVAGSTRERMLREMPEAIEVFTAEHALVLVLEDLHWSDYSTLDLLSFQTLEPEAEAEACFHKAREIARRQQAKSFELRAAVSLARLWRHQGNQDKDHQMLVKLCGWFTEGFDTEDLQEAKSLLTALSWQSVPEPTLPEMAGPETSPPNLRLVVSMHSKAPRSPRIPAAKRGRT
jgi:hypothetical protein